MSLSLVKRCTLTAELLLDIFRQLPGRIWRWWQHIRQLPVYFSSSILHGIRLPPASRFSLWIGEWLFLLLDILGFSEFYEIANCWLKRHSRLLTEEEKKIALAIFGPTLPLGRIQLDERAHLGPKQYRFCYVSFCVINSWEAMPPAILVHELVHVWQFHHCGSPYILRALLAQRTALGYNYGGFPALERARAEEGGLMAFNYEQQAAIIEDYFRLQQTGFARWSSIRGEKQLPIYQYFVADLQNQN